VLKTKKGGVFIDEKHLIEIVNKKLSQRMDMTRECSDAELKNLIGICIENIMVKIPGVNINAKSLLTEVFNSRRRMGLIQPFIENPAVNEIMINGTDNIFIEVDGVTKDSGLRYDNKEELFHNIQAMLSQSNRSVSESNPIVDAVLPGGSRINVVLNPVAINGPIVTIRKFTKQQYTIEDFIKNDTLTEEMAGYIKHAVFRGKSIIISGSTSSGKTTFMNMIAGFIPDDKRIITIEDSAELNIKSKNVVRLETRNANTEGNGEIKMRALIKAALRMRPDRLLIGEVRDESALELLTAMCTGHSGSMSTIHANSAEDTLVRLETMALWEGHVHSEAIKRMIVSGVDVVVFLERNEKGRRVKEIAEVCKNEKEKICLKKIF
jgi:pilus assembly protein CpaF